MSSKMHDGLAIYFAESNKAFRQEQHWQQKDLAGS
jgi:hypothetical protein